MAFTSEVKEELCELKVEKHLASAEVAGFLKFKGLLEIGKRTHLELSVKSTCAARRVKNILRILNAKDVEVFYREEKKLKRGRVFTFHIHLKDVGRFLNDVHLSTFGNVEQEIFTDAAFFGAFLRGAFIASGSIVDPSRHHHLELYNHHVDILKKIAKTLENFFGIKGHIARVKYGYRFYIKDGAMIEDFLGFIGAARAAQKIHNVMMEGRIRSYITRSLNFIEANSRRSGNATLKQINAILEVDKRFGLNSLPPQLKEVAKVRLENPECSLRELGTFFTPPLSKSVVHRRLQKIMRMAERDGRN